MNERRDRGSTLILVLVLVVVAGLIVVPLMSYAVSVLRLNTAVSSRTQQVEASKAGLRVALADPADVFKNCGSDPLPSPAINGAAVSTTCAVLSEVGPLDALGYEIPVGAVAMQLGAEVPATAVGTTAQSDPVPPYPATADWWSGLVPSGTEPQAPWDAVQDMIWLPELPRRPSVPRTDGSAPFHYSLPVSFDTSSGIECKVFFPGYYDQPVDLAAPSGTVYYYFASGVYYFEQAVTVSGDADVVVGYGLQDFEDRSASERSPCADDLQVATNVVNGPTSLAIDGGGATWVFGDEGRLIVDDTAGGSPSIRFNQRYSEEDRGGRISIMSVNGVANGATADPHDVPMVNDVPASQELETIDEENDVSQVSPIDATYYVPSNETYTDAARLPAAPNVTVATGKHNPGGGAEGALVVSWDEPVGNDAGGALVDSYEVTMSDGVGTVCDQPGDIVFTPGATDTDPGTLSCYVTGLALATAYDVDVTITNFVGTGPAATATVATPFAVGPNQSAPDPVTDVGLEVTDVIDVARVTWAAPADDGGAPITGYQATVERLFAEQHADEAPETFGGYVEVLGYTPITARVPAVDPNGGPLTLTVDPLTVPPGWDVQVVPDTLEVVVTPPPTGAPVTPLLDVFSEVDYEVTDSTGNVEPGTITIGWLHHTIERDPEAEDFDALLDPGVTAEFEVPASDPNGHPLTLTVDTSSLGPEWTVTTQGTKVVASTTLQDGSTQDIDYTVTDSTGRSGDGVIRLQAPTLGAEDRGSCTVEASPFSETASSCEITGLIPLVDPADLGYRARVEAVNAVGVSDAASSAPDPVDGHPMSFDGTGDPAEPTPERIVEPWIPDPIIDIDATGAGSTNVRIAGYVSVPMGRISIENPASDDDDSIELIGGTLAGTFDLVDELDVDSVVGFRNDIVLQRKVRIVSTAGSSTSTAVVQVNEDGAGYAINSWTVD